MNTLKNTTLAPRTIYLKSGAKLDLPPGRVVKIPDNIKKETEQFFTAGYGKAIAEKELVLIDSKKDIVVRQDKAEPPKDLTNPVSAGGVEASANAEKTINPNSDKKTDVKAQPSNKEF